ncbi:hypothetical protein RFI_20982 [Reticulomyxa filosa]|uniref:Uncharacterized protein n=1 Tax=Reticulomyxa filosa TaxID=46433 RepID=X6MSH7_RETFI|nr:hypothetical protein RFI_20982 [Reticulomyxa filosa]|eukprot:ETO16372.1 hypothetical protein RFI_20982 [Reticulomyxa filosa]
MPFDYIGKNPGKLYLTTFNTNAEIYVEKVVWNDLNPNTNARAYLPVEKNLVLESKTKEGGCAQLLVQSQSAIVTTYNSSKSAECAYFTSKTNEFRPQSYSEGKSFFVLVVICLFFFFVYYIPYTKWMYGNNYAADDKYGLVMSYVVSNSSLNLNSELKENIFCAFNMILYCNLNRSQASFITTYILFVSPSSQYEIIVTDSKITLTSNSDTSFAVVIDSLSGDNFNYFLQKFIKLKVNSSTITCQKRTDSSECDFSKGDTRTSTVIVLQVESGYSLYSNSSDSNSKTGKNLFEEKSVLWGIAIALSASLCLSLMIGYMCYQRFKTALLIKHLQTESAAVVINKKNIGTKAKHKQTQQGSVLFFKVYKWLSFQKNSSINEEKLFVS